MTEDFSKPHRGVAYFGIWASESADDYGRRDAARILAAAVECCTAADMRQDRQVMDAVAYLAAQGHDKRARAFRKALDITDPLQRRQQAGRVLSELQRGIQGGESSLDAR